MPHMHSALAWIENRVAGTAVEPLARRAWSEVRSIGRPRARQSLLYDRQTEEIMSRLLRETSNCIDVGAHHGSVLMSMCRLAPRGRHLAFEPIPELANALKQRFPKVDVRGIALSDVEGTSEFCHIVSSPGRSGFRRLGNVAASAEVRELRVQTDTLDNCVPADRKVDLIKVDVEGAHLQVFRGAARTLRQSRPFMIFEHGMVATETYGTTSEIVYDLLVNAYGLRISLLSDWLEQRAPLSAEAFRQHVGYHRGSHFCFLAHP